jgi:hypothetical protein
MNRERKVWERAVRGGIQERNSKQEEVQGVDLSWCHLYV